MRKIPVIIDTDPGIDDTVAIVALAGSEKADIRGITTTHGNIGLRGTTKNALALREFLNIDCPVAKGAAKPMIVPTRDASFIHGANGLAGFELPKPTKPVSDLAAWDLIYKEAKEFDGELVIIALGPLTNIAIAVLKYPDLKKYVKRIYMMGGSRDWGNHSQNAEFNVWGDPHACRVVLNRGIPITMADMRFGRECYLEGKTVKEIYTASEKLAPMFEAFWNRDINWVERQRKEKGEEPDPMSRHFVIYDATAAAACLLDGDGLVTKDYYVVCETQGSETRGQTIVDVKGRFGKEPNVQMAMSMDREKFALLLKSSVESFK